LQSHVSYNGDDCLFFPFVRVGYGTIGFEGRKWTVSRLMCKLVNGDPPAGYETAHSCGNGHLRCITPKHLHWKTPAQNQQDRLVHGTSNRGIRHGMSRLTEDDVRKIDQLLKTGKSQRVIAEEFGVGQVTISNIKTGKTWGWLTGVSP
jgi:hypothetical protein